MPCRMSSVDWVDVRPTITFTPSSRSQTLDCTLDLDIIAMYDAAWKQQPFNEELGINVFSANTRAANWKAAQQVSARPSASRARVLHVHD